MSTPIAYFLTWSTYGTWLHGDSRGSVDSHHNKVPEPRIPDHPGLESRRQTSMKEAAFALDAVARPVVMRAVVDHCMLRNWTLEALNVRSTHVHAVVRSGGCAPEQVLLQLKSWSTRRLRAAGLVDERSRLWTEHGSTQYLWDESGVLAAARYVLNEQGADLGTSAGRLWRARDGSGGK